MNQATKKKPVADQFQYLGRWVDKQHFRAFVYDKDGKEKLANSHKEFEDLTASGLWFASKLEAEPQKRKQKDGVAVSNSK